MVVKRKRNNKDASHIFLQSFTLIGLGLGFILLKFFDWYFFIASLLIFIGIGKIIDYLRIK